MLLGLKLQIEELGLLLCNLVTVVPEGIVVFFSSFDYEGQVHDAWKASGILERIMKKKCVFREPRKNTDVEFVLKEYKEAIDKSSDRNQKEDPVPQNGAILLAVVGGKISEGINFSDGMGRCIVMVGLPYPSPSDIELLERVKYIEGLGVSISSRSTKFSVGNEYYSGDVQVGFDILRSCKHRGKEYYENLCMKAVNQSIGASKLLYLSAENHMQVDRPQGWFTRTIHNALGAEAVPKLEPGLTSSPKHHIFYTIRNEFGLVLREMLVIKSLESSNKPSLCVCCLHVIIHTQWRLLLIFTDICTLSLIVCFR